MRRLPIRIRVTLAFAAAMAVLLAGLSGFLVLRLQSQLDETIQQGLETRASDLAALASTPQAPRRTALPDEDVSVFQVLDARGRVIGGAPGAPSAPLLTPAQLASARRDSLQVDTHIGDEHTSTRLLAARSGDSVIVVGQSLEARDEAVRQLSAQLLVGVPAALLLAWPATSRRPRRCVPSSR
jgi:hypothetical protein